MGKFSKIIAGVGVILVLVILVLSTFEEETIEEEAIEEGSVIEESDDALPQFIQSDWIDLSRIGSVSKFRSGSGHDFSGNGETCRSMKHYFNPIRSQEDEMIVSQNNGYPPPFSLEGAIPIYSPVDGEITSIKVDGELGEQVYIKPDGYSEFTVRLFHIYLLDGFKEGSEVTAGEQIGNIGRIQNADIAVMKGSLFGNTFVSYFEVMSDEVFAEYQALGIESREELIITKEYRDAHPFECDGEQFTENRDQGNSDEFVYINQE